jgi:hypothetical protein
MLLRIKNFVDSLSLVSGAVLIALVSAVVVWLLCFVLPVALRRFSIVVVPLILAHCLYWLPIWLGNDPFEYGAWAMVLIVPWFLTGAFSSALTVLVVQKHRA